MNKLFRYFLYDRNTRILGCTKIMKRFTLSLPDEASLSLPNKTTLVIFRHAIFGHLPFSSMNYSTVLTHIGWKAETSKIKHTLEGNRAYLTLNSPNIELHPQSKTGTMSGQLFRPIRSHIFRHQCNSQFSMLAHYIYHITCRMVFEIQIIFRF